MTANAVWLSVASFSALFFMDIPGIFFGYGPQARMLATAPHAGVGFIEAHGLALIFGVLLWRAPATRSWHITALAIHALLGTANLLFWQFFSVGNMLAAGYLTTSLHFASVALQLYAAMARTGRGGREPRRV